MQMGRARSRGLGLRVGSIRPGGELAHPGGTVPLRRERSISSTVPARFWTARVRRFGGSLAMSWSSLLSSRRPISRW